MEKIAEIIMKRRKELGLTQKELAERLDISDKTVSRWETGIQVPETLLMPKLAEMLKISINELYGIEEHNPTSPGKTDTKKPCQAGIFISSGLFILAALIFKIFRYYVLARQSMQFLMCIGLLILGFTRVVLKPSEQEARLKWFGLAYVCLDAAILLIFTDFYYMMLPNGKQILLGLLGMHGAVFVFSGIYKKKLTEAVWMQIFAVCTGVSYLLYERYSLVVGHYGFTSHWNLFCFMWLLFFAAVLADYIQISRNAMRKKSRKWIAAAAIIAGVITISLPLLQSRKPNVYNLIAEAYISKGDHQIVTEAEFGVNVGTEYSKPFPFEGENIQELLNLLKKMKISAVTAAENQPETAGGYQYILLKIQNKETEVSEFIIIKQDTIYYGGAAYALTDMEPLEVLWENVMEGYEGENKELYERILLNY